LNELSGTIAREDLVLYRDDELAILRGVSGPDTERIWKNIIHIFKEHGFQITTEAGLTQTDFLDVTFNLDCSKFWPYRKPGDIPAYINKKSNHLPNIKRSLSGIISKRMSQLSCNAEEFNKAAPLLTTKR